MKSIVVIVGVVLAIAWLIDYLHFWRERQMAQDKRNRERWRWNDGDPPEGDY